MTMSTVDGCGAPDQSATLPASVDIAKETVITGVVRSGDAPVGGAYVRLLDSTGEFTAEVVTSPAGQFRFFAAPGILNCSMPGGLSTIVPMPRRMEDGIVFAA